MTPESGSGLRLDDLVREIPGRVDVSGDGGVRVRGVQQDSRRVAPGDLFVVRKGASADGAAYVSEATARGAVALLVGRDAGPVPSSLPVLMVDDAADGLAFAAAAVYGHPAFGLEIVGITGTNGKTTTTHLVRAAIDGALGGANCGIVGTVGHRFKDFAVEASHTTPEADELARVLAAMKTSGATHVAMEVSSIALASKRVRAIRFRVAALTSLTQDHLDYHGTMDRYAEAKAQLFTAYSPAAAVLNVDDAFGRAMAAQVRAPCLRVSAQVGAAASGADVAPVSAEVDAHGIRAVVRTVSGEVTLRSRLVGRHNLENLLLAVGIACALELDIPRATAALADEPGAPGRLERCDSSTDDIAVLVDYAHTPDALARALDAIRSVCGGKVWCVFGCGGDRDAGKRAPMGEAAARRVDVAVITNDNPRSEDPEHIAAAIVDGVRGCGLSAIERADLATGGRGYHVELDRGAAIEAAIVAASSGDLVLIAGKGHEDYQIVGQAKRPFDDRVEARRALVRRRARKAELGAS
jgi:UDP-N-acetylmuramoyl-L-alanyl-D-glutamate--2,6-diaminopimelate ligase